MTSTANTRPSRPSVARVSIDCSMNGAWSNTIVNSASGKLSLSSSIAAITPFDTSTVLAAGSFVIEIDRASSPLTREIDETGSDASSTVATSAIVASVPTNGRAAISSTEVIFAPVWTVSVSSFSVISPPGNSVPFCSSASRIDWSLAPAAARSAWSGVMVICWPSPPTISAALTPSTSSKSGTATFSRSVCAVSASSNPVTATWMTGKSSIDTDSTCGSTSSGSSEEIRLIDCCIFCSAVARFSP